MGIEPPRELTEKVRMIEPWMRFYIQAYVDLSTEANDRGYIPWRAINDYAQRYGFVDWGFEWFNRCIRAIEEHVLAKRAAASGGQADVQQPESA